MESLHALYILCAFCITTSISLIAIDSTGIRIISHGDNVANVKLINQTGADGLRTFGAVFTVFKDLPPHNIVLSVKPYFDRKGRAVPAPVKYSQNICEALEKNIISIQTVLKHSNLTYCPIKAGTYYLDNWMVKKETLPPIPVGKYMADLMFLVDDKEWATVRWWGGIIKV